MGVAIAKAGAWLARRAEDFTAALLVAMFAAFVLQVVFRYVFGWPTGWTTEVCLVTWLWVVLWGSSVAVGESSEIRFDVLYTSVPRRFQRWFTIISASALVILYGISLPATISYVTFMKVEKSPYMNVRFDYLFSIYVLFAVASICRYGWLIRRAWKDGPDAAGSRHEGEAV